AAAPFSSRIRTPARRGQIGETPARAMSGMRSSALGLILAASLLSGSRIALGQAVVEFDGALGPNGITAGPDGNLWFAEVFGVARITPAGMITHFPPPEFLFSNQITVGPDGNMWVTDTGDDIIGRATPPGQSTNVQCYTGLLDE